MRVVWGSPFALRRTWVRLPEFSLSLEGDAEPEACTRGAPVSMLLSSAPVFSALLCRRRFRALAPHSVTEACVCVRIFLVLISFMWFLQAEEAMPFSLLYLT